MENLLRFLTKSVEHLLIPKHCAAAERGNVLRFFTNVIAHFQFRADILRQPCNFNDAARKAYAVSIHRRRHLRRQRFEYGVGVFDNLIHVHAYTVGQVRRQNGRRGRPARLPAGGD